MLTFTESARGVLLGLLSQMEGAALRVACVGGSPLAPEYELTLVDEKETGDVAVSQGEFRVFIAADSLPMVQGRTVDYMEADAGAGFVVRQPDAVRQEGGRPEGPLAERVLEVLERHVNPSVAQHGGSITLVGVKDDVAYIEMSGGCQGCGMARVTLRQGVERMLRQAVPELQGIVDVTDHAGGENPYYAKA
ncbi:MAG: NifU family protein [Longimicrobiales bacterium]